MLSVWAGMLRGIRLINGISVVIYIFRLLVSELFKPCYTYAMYRISDLSIQSYVIPLRNHKNTRFALILYLLFFGSGFYLEY